MYVCLDQDIDAADSIELNFVVFIVSPVSHLDQVFSAREVFFVT